MVFAREQEGAGDGDGDFDGDGEYEDDLIDLNLDQDDNPYISSNSSNYPSLPLPVPFPFITIFAHPLLVPPQTVLVPETPSPTSHKSPHFSFTMSEAPSPHKKIQTQCGHDLGEERRGEEKRVSRLKVGPFCLGYL